MCYKTLVSLLVLERWWLLATSPLYRSRWRDRMETLSTSSAFCEGIQQALEQTDQQLIVWDVMKHMWRHSHTNGNRPAVKPIKDVHIVTSWRREAFRITGPLWKESIGHRWFPSQRASYVEFWYFLWRQLEQIVEQTVERQLNWDVFTLIWLRCNDVKLWKMFKVGPN